MTESYQNFVPPYPRVRLATLPSPLERAERLEAALRDEGCSPVPRIYLKRDDLLSLGMGGNKIRNLEFSLAAAIGAGATDIVTAGRQQSNHCRLTAAACARLGLRAHLVFNGPRPLRRTGNLLLDDLFGARTYFTGSDTRELRQYWIDIFVSMFNDTGRKVVVIPVGGSDARGALGHALAALELVRQCDEIGEPLAAIVLATATGGTQAGMLAGLRKLGSTAVIHGFAVASGAPELRDTVVRLCAEVAADIGIEALPDANVVVDGSMLGGGYGEPTAEAEAAIMLLARTEGIVADPVYTGKGFAGLLALVRAGGLPREGAVVFVHTGGAPALFAGA